MENDYALKVISDNDTDSFNFDDLQSSLEAQLDDQMADLSNLKLDLENIDNPDSLTTTVTDVVWEQFINQIGAVAGEEFIKENRDLTLNLKKSAHIQTTENFAKGKIATHNSEINYQDRYQEWQLKFVKDDNGNVITHGTRSGRQEPYLAGGARVIFDTARPSGSKEKRIDMDHTISAGEIIRNPAANAHLDVKEQAAFANGPTNLHEMDASHNRSKKDTPMTEWLDLPNSSGNKPSEIFDIDDKLDKEYRRKDKAAREDFDRVILDGEKKSISTGKKSRKEETFRIGGKGLQSVLMSLLANLVKTIVKKLIAWLTSANKNFDSFLNGLKEAIKGFFGDLKQHLVEAGSSLLTTIANAIFGPIVSMVKKAWLFLKQGYKSLKEAISYIKDPNNRGKSVSILMLEVGKIIIAGLTASGAIILGEVIEKALSAVPFLAFPIPLIGSLASILGLFFGALGSGIIGAIGLNLIDKMIAKKRRSIIVSQNLSKGNDVLYVQKQLLNVVSENLSITKSNLHRDIHNRHEILSDLDLPITGDSFQKNSQTQNDADIDGLFDLLNT